MVDQASGMDAPTDAHTRLSFASQSTASSAASALPLGDADALDALCDSINRDIKRDMDNAKTKKKAKKAFVDREAVAIKARARVAAKAAAKAAKAAKVTLPAHPVLRVQPKRKLQAKVREAPQVPALAPSAVVPTEVSKDTIELEALFDAISLDAAKLAKAGDRKPKRKLRCVVASAVTPKSLTHSINPSCSRSPFQSSPVPVDSVAETPAEVSPDEGGWLEILPRIKKPAKPVIAPSPKPKRPLLKVLNPVANAKTLTSVSTVAGGKGAAKSRPARLAESHRAVEPGTPEASIMASDSDSKPTLLPTVAELPELPEASQPAVTSSAETSAVPVPSVAADAVLAPKHVQMIQCRVNGKIVEFPAWKTMFRKYASLAKSSLTAPSVV